MFLAAWDQAHRHVPKEYVDGFRNVVAERLMKLLPGCGDLSDARKLVADNGHDPAARDRAVDASAADPTSNNAGGFGKHRTSGPVVMGP